MKAVLLCVVFLFSAISIAYAQPDNSIKEQVDSLQATVSTQNTDIENLKKALEDLIRQVDNNKTGIETNKTDIATSKTEIGTNKNNIASNATGIAINKSGIGTNKTDIGKLNTALEAENVAWNEAVAHEGELREFADGFLDFFVNKLLIDVADANRTIGAIHRDIRDHFDELNMRLYTTLLALHEGEPSVDTLFVADATTYENLLDNSKTKLDEIVCSSGMELVMSITCPAETEPNVDKDTIKSAFDWAGKTALARQEYDTHAQSYIKGKSLVAEAILDTFALNDTLVSMRDDMKTIADTYAFVYDKMASCIKSDSCAPPFQLDLFTYTLFATFEPVFVKGTLSTSCSEGTSSNKYAALGGGFFGSTCN